MKKTDTFIEAERLYNLGFGILWLHKKSKRPIQNKWATGERNSWAFLKDSYKEGNNVGVRLGSASKIGERGFLCVVDVDVKSTEKRHLKEAQEAVRKLLGEYADQCPQVESGRGGGSCHLYCVTPEPFKTFNPAMSDEFVKVMMPSKKASKKELEALSPEEIEEGWRLSRAWEISLYSNGRQVVLPPSIHPDSGRHYAWVHHVKNEKSFPVIQFDIPEENENDEEQNERGLQPKTKTSKKVSSENAADEGTRNLRDFVPVSVDLDLLDLPARITEGITTGKEVEDRSAFLVPAATALIRAGCSRDEVLSVLTDPDYYISSCAFEHAKTTNRVRAARWLWRYTLEYLWRERAEARFSEIEPSKQSRSMTPEQVLEQERQLKEDGSLNWQSGLQKERGKLLPTITNVKLILTNVFGPECFKLNEFAAQEEIWGSFPWNEKPGREAWDIDINMIRDWLAKKWNFEPSKDKVQDVCAVVAFENRYHPVKNWLNTLPAWDENRRLDYLLEDYIPCEGDEELRAVCGRRFMVALVKRIFEPGCQFDSVLILEGLQGIKKSSAFRALVGDKWFSDASFNVEDKDAVMTIFSKWLIEFGELSTLDKATLEHTKAFITRRTDRIRAPFDRKARDYPRQCLFVGSTNKDSYFKDEENRRYWPFKVQGICDTDAIEKDREQLFAEALYLYQLEEPVYLVEEELSEKMKGQQDMRQMHDVLLEQVQEVLSAYQKMNKRLWNNETILYFFENERIKGVKNDQYGTARVGAILRKLGYDRHREGGGSRRWIWSKKGEK